MLEVIKALMNEESLRENKAAMRSARRIIQATESSDSEVLNYSNWLKEKVKS